MKLRDVPNRQTVRVRGTGKLAQVIEHEPSGVLVLARRRREVPFNGRLIVTYETHTEIWSDAAEVDLIGQLVFDLSGEGK